MGNPRRAVHVVPARGYRWKVKSAGAKRAAAIVPTMAEAIQIGRRIAMNNGRELIVHRRDGTIRSRDAFGNDPFPPVMEMQGQCRGNIVLGDWGMGGRNQLLRDDDGV